jgi:hypothetical protein
MLGLNNTSFGTDRAVLRESVGFLGVLAGVQFFVAFRSVGYVSASLA